jgi:diguanylate cyclase (GGDEF)-like protein
VRRADIAIRFGGDELLLVLPGADLSEARIVASRVRATIRNDVSVVAGEGELISATIGVAAHGSGDTFERVFERADTALRRAKALGRDRVLCDGDE